MSPEQVVQNAEVLLEYLHIFRTFEMAPEQKKRARPIPNASQRSKKRQKVEPVKPATDAVVKRPVVLDALPWNEVQMPDMFNDAEGFFGLEEIEGVEVVREGNTVKFVRMQYNGRTCWINWS